MIPVIKRARAEIHATISLLPRKNQNDIEDKLTLIDVYKTLKIPLPINSDKKGICFSIILTLS